MDNCLLHWSEIRSIPKIQGIRGIAEDSAWQSDQATQSDRGGEFLSNEFTNHLKKNGTLQSLTVHDTPEENGIAERLNRTLLEHTSAMLMTAQLLKNLWPETIHHAVWLKN